MHCHVVKFMLRCYFLDFQGQRSVGTTELKYSTKKRQHFLHTESFFRPTLVEYETSESDQGAIKNYIARYG